MPSLMECLARQKACGMVNAISAGQKALIEAYACYPEVELALDSGAYQGYTDVEAYSRLLKKVGPRMLWCSSLDVLHNQKASDENYKRLKDLLSDDVGLSEKILWIYQCQSRKAIWNQQGDLDALTRALERHHFIGIGGIVSVIERDLSEAQDLLEAIGEVLDAAGAEAHVFGIGNFTLLVQYCAKRWFRSADSARWLQGLRSRKLFTTDGKSFLANTLTFTGLQCAEQNVRAIRSWMQPDVSRQLFLFPDSDAESSTVDPHSLERVSRSA